eukprot:1362422-Amorphochlora_amoeboformis.AAC.1
MIPLTINLLSDARTWGMGHGWDRTSREPQMDQAVTWVGRKQDIRSLRCLPTAGKVDIRGTSMTNSWTRTCPSPKTRKIGSAISRGDAYCACR